MLTVVVKNWPRPRWRHVSLTFQFSEVCQSFPPKSMLYLTSSRPSPLRGSLRSKDFSESSNSSNRSPLISANNYATFLSSTFITCNVTQRGTYRQWQIFLHSIPTNQHHWSRPLQRANHAITKISPIPIDLHAYNSVKYKGHSLGDWELLDSEFLIFILFRLQSETDVKRGPYNMVNQW